MSSLLSFFESDFNNQREQWENALKSELKLTEIGNKGEKKLLTGKTWPTLSLSSNAIHLGVNEKWKKASITHSFLQNEKIAEMIGEDLSMGVRNFFFHHTALDADKWASIEAALKKHSTLLELEVFILGSDQEHFTSSSLKVVSKIISGQGAHDQGGHSVQELALFATNLIHAISSGKSKELYLGVYLDSQFFHNIAKVRAAKLLALKIIDETGNKNTFKIVGLTSYRDWTVFERYSNMLRNEASVASGYIGGADHIQSSGYNTVLELEAENFKVDEHQERSLRMARNTTHILGLESMLGVVEDAAFGSFHIESLTQTLAEEAWKLMQTYVSLSPSELSHKVSTEVAPVREKRLDLVKTRKHVMSGMNDYPDVKEVMNVKLKPSAVFRVGRVFEELRLKMEMSKKPSVYIALFGDYGALNGRLNFVKNYFELLGLTVHDPGHSETDLENFKKNLFSRKEEIIVLCAADDQYETLAQVAESLSKDKFIAGKTEVKGLKNLFAGQNVYEVLLNLTQTYAGGKA